jgi:hypothetical protein
LRFSDGTELVFLAGARGRVKAVGDRDARIALSSKVSVVEQAEEPGLDSVLGARWLHKDVAFPARREPTTPRFCWGNWKRRRSTGTSDLITGKWLGPGRFSGSFDDIAIYDRALSAAEVAELHARPPPGPT